MANCISCHRQIEDSFAFCPNCGADNRPPEHRQAISYCPHQFVPGGVCCILCGAGYDEPAGSTPVLRHRAVMHWLLAGLVFTALLAYLLIAANTMRVPLSGLAHSLFGYEYTSYSYSRYSYSYHRTTSSLGLDLAFGLGGLALLSFFQAFRLQRKLGSMDPGDLAAMAWWEFFWFW
ncbi:MAG: hypothetical protein ACHQ50_06370 [Fimbriimonadales bacterium]